MIQKPNDWDTTQAFSERQKIPAGPYICKVKQVAIRPTSNGSEQLNILFDVTEGDYAGYFDNDYKTNTRFGQKWRGVFRQWLPKNDGSDLDKNTVGAFKGMTQCFEESNPGYTWNWEEKTLVGKMIGIMFRDEEWENDSGNSGWSAKPYRVLTVDQIRNGRFKIPEPKALDRSKVKTQTYTELKEEDGDLPF